MSEVTLKELFSELQPVLVSLTIFYIFTFYPLAIYFWSKIDIHWLYYSLIGGIALFSSALLHNTLKRFISQRKNLLLEIMALFNILNIIICVVFIAFPLKFFFFTTKYYSLFTSKVIDMTYLGPNFMRAATIFILISNIIFFLSSLMDKPEKKPKIPEKPQYKAMDGFEQFDRYKKFNN